MKTYQMMQEMRGCKNIILANAPMFSGNLTEYCEVKDIMKTHFDEKWYIVAANGFYTYRVCEAVSNNIFGDTCPLRILTTDLSSKAIINYLTTTNTRLYDKQKHNMEILRQLVGSDLTDAKLLLWLLNTKCTVDLTSPMWMHDVAHYVKTKTSQFKSYSDVLWHNLQIPLEEAQIKLHIDAMIQIIESSNHSKARNYRRANDLLTAYSGEPEQLLFWLLRVISICRCAEKENKYVERNN